MKESIGVCLGASTVSIVRAKQTKNKIEITQFANIAHKGNPREILSENLRKFEPLGLPVVVTGRKFRKSIKLDNISEPEATELAFANTDTSATDFTSIASLGGETFMVYTLDDEGKISNVITKNQCASGTGEFFLQQIKRMDISVEESIKISKDAPPFKVSGRCSVFCKSDCTHALNKGTPKSEVTAGLSLMIADKIDEMLKKVKVGSCLLVGGVTQNSRVTDFIKQKYPKIEVPASAIYFEAYGAAVYALQNDVEPLADLDDIFEDHDSSFSFHKPLRDYEDMVSFKTMEKGKANNGDRCILGLDVGSTTTKAVVIRESDNALLGSVYLYTNGNPIEASRKCYAELLKQIPESIELIGVGVTGSGRQIAGLHALTDGVYNEIIAHATAAVYFDPEVDTIFEIGGQDAKYTYIVNKVPADYAMNEACSAGTGSFIEESAYESLKIDVKDIQDIALRGNRPPNFSDQCAAFISSDIKTALQENISKEDVVAGLVYSICLNYVNRVKGSRPVGKKIFMQGGVCYNEAIPIAMAALSDKNIIVPPEPGLMGAFGVALEVKEKIKLGLLEEKTFELSVLAHREVVYHPPFICKGGREKCDMGCKINIIEVQKKKYPFGGACNRYYNIRYKSKVNAEEFDYVKKRNDLMFKKYAAPADLPPDAKTVGINLSFLTHTIYPLYYNFFTHLGFKVIIPDSVDEDGLEREMTAFCFPGQLSLCLFEDLMKKNPDYIFMPNISEMHVNKEDHYRIDFNSTCVFVISEPFYIKQAFKDYDLSNMISPHINFASGFDSQIDKFIHIGEQMGEKDVNKIAAAYHFAVDQMRRFQKDKFELGKQFLRIMENEPDKFAMLLVGRPYNSFTDTANKGIPQKFASRGVYVAPYDIFDYRNEEVPDDMFWEGGKKILKISKIIKRHPQLFATYISNFSCGPDSFIIPAFRDIMGTKPSLTLELDSHSADAGINTRIDAALDIIKNYLKVSGGLKDPDYIGYTPAKIEYGDDENLFISSDGEKFSLMDKRIKVLIPSMGDLPSRMFAAGMRSQGYNAEVLPEGSNEILKYGRANTTGKECLPFIMCAGAMIDYIENRWDGKEHLAFFNISSSGNCRIGQYPPFLRALIKKRKLRNVAVLALSTDDGYAGMGPKFAQRGVQALFTGDVMEDIRSAIYANAADVQQAMDVFNSSFAEVEKKFDLYPDDLINHLEEFSAKLKKNIKTKTSIENSKFVALTGEIYVRHDHFEHKWLNKKLAESGFIVKTAHITEWLYYIDYLIKKKLVEPNASFKNKVERKVRIAYMRQAEKKIKKALEKSGLYKYKKTLIEPLLSRSTHIVPLEFKGETGLTVGTALHETLEDIAGVINIGPFGCMPTRVTEAVITPELTLHGKVAAEQKVNKNYQLPEIFNGKTTIPFLTIESDGNVYPQVIEARIETFTLQAERVAQKMLEMRKNGNSKGHSNNLLKKFNIKNKLKA